MSASGSGALVSPTFKASLAPHPQPEAATTDEREKKLGAGHSRSEMPSTSWAQVARDALASTNDLTAISPETLAKLLVFEARDDDVPLFSLPVTVRLTPSGGKTY